jgi:hypothetical protein|tara:strand:+ start:257 stop:619 length:363 start_codon:yes stop_codon:yes gene_type:complete
MSISKDPYYFLIISSSAVGLAKNIVDTVREKEETLGFDVPLAYDDLEPPTHWGCIRASSLVYRYLLSSYDEDNDMLFFFKINNIKKTLMETNSADCSSLVGDKITFNKVLDKMGLYKLKQ